jgi:hypothetical protein
MVVHHMCKLLRPARKMEAALKMFAAISMGFRRAALSSEGAWG